MTRAEFIKAYASRSGLEAKFANIGILDAGGRAMAALPCACGDNCEGWAMVSADSIISHLELYAPEPLRAAYSETVTAAGGQ